MIGKIELHKIVDEIYNLPDTMQYCPNCNNETVYIANPFYMHICEHCKAEYNNDMIITIYKKDIAVDLLYQFIVDNN